MILWRWQNLPAAAAEYGVCLMVSKRTACACEALSTRERDISECGQLCLCRADKFPVQRTGPIACELDSIACGVYHLRQ